MYRGTGARHDRAPVPFLFAPTAQVIDAPPPVMNATFPANRAIASPRHI
jgi:hypothetical protein